MVYSTSRAPEFVMVKDREPDSARMTPGPKSTSGGDTDRSAFLVRHLKDCRKVHHTIARHSVVLP